MVSFFLHENGHAMPLRFKHGVRYGIIYIGYGAATSSDLKQRLGMNHFANVEVAAGGPIVTMIWAVFLYSFGYATKLTGGDPIVWYQLCGFNTALAVANMVPWPKATDGGKILRWIFASSDEQEDKRFAILLVGLAAIIMVGFFYFVNPIALIFFALTVIVGSLRGSNKDNPADADSPQSMGEERENQARILYVVLLVTSLVLFWLLPQYDIWRAARMMLGVE